MSGQDKARTADAAVLIGRFQPFHNGHLHLLQRALERAPTVIVVLGSAFHARNTKNPLTWQERAAMIASALPETQRERVRFVATRDYYDDRRWSAEIRHLVAGVAGEQARIVLIGHFKDASSYYLRHFPHWELEALERAVDIDATDIRRLWFEAEDMDVTLDVLAQMLPASARHYLRAWSLLPHYAPLAEEHRQLQKYKTAWSAAPYPPIFTTVDAVIRAADYVLLVQRKGFPGRGLWAIPGGFLDQRERLMQAALRELAEETNLAVLPITLEDALVDVKIFDHPDRSARGRTITHAYYFDLRLEHLPAVEAADDAAQAVWTPIAQLATMEESFFDDHFHILDSFLKLTGER
ncbi:bifunctional nicotinamide-nucleotide adenylyltransferase/Nudix hydroxylase [Herbaspirillum chlorophenolicum]|uniref:bifunctional nicotinamide-nucleotide adenylyltransferase/Nudix hydroxylase n=1 Tax=Herbaspirillum chlorophenolicum TaxID=211589 RepID=UPI00067CB3C6|nr:bifunctional nicotinamide-nucleotide adenylyltransferase/Nudix hydroxylase [Herbaspirillum chlorophenolicum]